MNFQHDDILIVGDSFCAQREKADHWPFLLYGLLNKSPKWVRGRGFGGSAWWSVRKRLLQEIKTCMPKLLILCHTEASRIPHAKDLGINSLAAETNRIVTNNILVNLKELNKIAEASRMYYEFLWDWDYCCWAQEAWFRELDDLLSQWQIPYVIHLYCFGHDSYVFKNGITAAGKLVDLVDPDKPQYANHFTSELNIHVANRLLHAIENYQPGLQDLGLNLKI
jgi:hypothetical protein